MGLELELDQELCDVLSGLLLALWGLPDGTDVSGHLGPRPWGDLGRFREFVFLPIESGQPSLTSPGADTVRLALTDEESHHIGLLLRALSESYSGGAPWMALHQDARRAVFQVRTRLRAAMDDLPLTEAELSTLEALSEAATPGPWTAHLEEDSGSTGSSMISLDGLTDDFPPDMYVSHDQQPAPSADIRFIAAARSALPRLLREIRKSRN